MPVVKKKRAPRRSTEQLILKELKRHTDKLNTVIELLDKIWKEEQPHVNR